MIAEFFRLDRGWTNSCCYIAPHAILWWFFRPRPWLTVPVLLPEQMPVSTLREAAEEFDDDGGVFIHYLVETH